MSIPAEVEPATMARDYPDLFRRLDLELPRDFVDLVEKLSSRPAPCGPPASFLS